MSLLSGSVLLSLSLAAASSADIARGVDRLGHVGNVLYVAAHPDDENTRLLTWLVRDRHLRASYLSLTRGEGGQNLIGSEQGALLGAIREQELYAARGIDGAGQIFGGMADFGYSKNPEETLRIWGKDKALAEVIAAIRRFRPDVIITRFSPQARDTHGHHTASAMLALEAFTKAADPKVMPTLAPWQTKRIVWNKGVFGPAKPEDVAGFYALDVSGFDPALGVSYGEISARARSMHKSQGFGAVPQRGPQLEYFQPLVGDVASPVDGIDWTWARVNGGEPVAAAIAAMRKSFELDRPQASIEPLLAVHKAIEAMPANPWKDDKLTEAKELVIACAGLFLDATIDDAAIVSGQPAKVTVTALARTDVPVSLTHVRVASTQAKPGKVLEIGKPLDTALDVTAEPGMRAEITLTIAGKELTVERALSSVQADPVIGEVRRPIAAVPATMVTPLDPLVVFATAQPQTVRVLVRASRTAVKGAIGVEAPKGFVVQPKSAAYSLDKAGAEQTVVFTITPPKSPALGVLTFTGGDRVRSVDYGHIPRVTVVDKAQVKLVRLELQRQGDRIGYVNGAGDDVADALRRAGYAVTLLDDAALADLPIDAPFDAIVTGVRAFNVRADLARRLPRLHAWVEAGGTLVVQYNTNSRIGPLTAQLGPWPFQISQERVTDETAVMTLADDPIWRAPNAIEKKDFDGWVQERGLYFAGTWDEKYRAPLACNDPSEPARKGSVLVADYGKGRFVYTGLAFFRQLPAGVPGAFRLFANLLAHGK